MRKLLCLLLVTLLLGKPETAHACAVLGDYEHYFAKASTVFVGHIVRTEEAGTIQLHDSFAPEPAAEATFRIMDVLKGQPPADGKVRFRGTKYCDEALLAGQTYAIFLYQDNLIRGPNEGITRLGHIQIVDAKSLLAQLREQREEEVKRKRELHRAWDEGKENECWSLLKQKSYEDAVLAATNIFIGYLARTEEVEKARIGNAPPTPVVEGTFQVLKVLKGQAPPDGKVRTSVVDTPCNGPVPYLVPGNVYQVSLDQDNRMRDASRTAIRDLSGKAQ